MLLHRAVALLIVFFVCGAASPSAYAATDNSTAAGTMSVYSKTVAEYQNNRNFSIYAIRSGGSSGAASVLCNTVNGTAVAGRDYTAVSTTLHWASGDASPKKCAVPVSDATPFRGSKTFFVELSGATGAVLGSANKSTVIIYGNKNAGEVSMSRPTYTVAQNAGKVAITVNRTGGSYGPAVVQYATANKTAIAGTDYTSEHGALTWENGDATPKSFVIPISNAKPFTGTKTLAVAIAHANDAVLGSSSSAIVTIDGGSGTTKPVVTIEATPTAIPVGSAAVLSWKASNATTCTGSGAWSGARATSGSTSTGNIASASTYTLTCSGTGGTAAQSATVKVVAGAPTVTLSASPSRVTSGGHSTLAWSSTHATACTATGAWTGAEPTSGSQSTHALTADTTYALTCTGTGGSASQSAVVSVVSSSVTSTIPNVTALPANFPSPDTTGYGKLDIGSRPSGYSWNDTVTGVKTWKITAAGTPGSSSYFPWYSSAGLEISLPWGPNLDQYHIAFIDASGNGYVCDFGLSTSATPGPYNFRALPFGTLVSYAQTVSAFSRINANIMYILTSSGYLRLYDVATNAYVDSQAASLGYSASWPATGWPWNTKIMAWVTCNAAETWCIANNAGGDNGTAMYALNLTNGKAITWNVSADDSYVAYGDFVSGDQQSKIWSLDTNTQFNINPELTAANGWLDSEPTSHGGSLRGYYIYFNTDGNSTAPMQAAVIDQSTGAATIGSETALPHNPKYWGEYHVSGEWWLQSPGADQYILQSNWDTPSGAPGPASEQYAMTLINVWAGTGYRLGFSYSNYINIGSMSDYWTQPHASISHDGKLVIFGSDMLGTSRIDLFAIEVPVTPGVPPSFP
jgi:hypothetical protein